MSEITAEELLRRITVARDEAETKYRRLMRDSEAAEPNVGVGLAVQARSYRAVAEVLDLIVSPRQ